ncbi:MAG: DUF1425 domain-containing protein [Phycisphaeraceae bacterium]
MRRLTTTLTALLAAAMLTGCYTPGNASPDPIPNANYPQVVTTGWLDNDFYVGPPIVVPEDNGRPMKVTVEVRRLEPAWNRELPCQYRFIFLDENGAALDPDPTWYYRSIEPKVKTILQGSAPDTGAVDWRCEIRKDRADRRRTLWRWY